MKAPGNLSTSWYEAAMAWTELKAASDLLEDTRSSVFAQMVMRHGDIPTNRAENIVRASKEWQDHVKKIVDAKTATNRAEVKMNYIKMRYYEAQSQQATERVEARLS